MQICYISNLIGGIIMYDFLVDIFKKSTLIDKLDESEIIKSFEDGSILLNKYKKNRQP